MRRARRVSIFYVDIVLGRKEDDLISSSITFNSTLLREDIETLLKPVSSLLLAVKAHKLFSAVIMLLLAVLLHATTLFNKYVDVSVPIPSCTETRTAATHSAPPPESADITQHDELGPPSPAPPIW